MIKFFIITFLFLFFGAAPVFANNVVINEFMAHPSTGNSEWVELYNPDNIDLSSYWVDDDTSFTSDSGNSTKKSLNSLNITTSSFPYIELSSFLNNPGDFVVLFSNDGTIIDQYQYTSDPGTGVTIGRSPDGDNWTTLATSSKGSSNGGPSSTPTSSPTPTPASIPSPTSSGSTTSSFTISNVPPQINSDQSFNVLVNLTLPNNETTDYYLSGAFKKADGTRYFGLTKINSSWIKYESANYLNQYKITTDEGGNWTGNLEVKPDTSDTDYKGSGDYIFKVGRYTSSGSGPTWSNESIIKIISVGNDQTNTSSLTSPSPTPKPSNSPSSTKTKTSTSNQPRSYDRLVYHNASAAAATTSANSSTSSVELEVKNQKQTSPIVWIGVIFIFAGLSTLGYIYLKKNAKIYFPFRR